MKQVIITKGLPGSGKSTWAKKLIDKNPNQYKRINKDDLRAMLDNSKHSKDAEKFVLRIRNQIMLMALEEGKHVIIDDTNLHPKHEKTIRELTKGIAEVIIQDFTDVELEVCIKRDLNRLNSVGEKVIRQMYNDFLAPKPEEIVVDPSLPHAIICDLDGTLALLIKDKLVLLVSGREDKYREQTINFLDKHQINHEKLMMRETGDFRKDSIIKKEIFDTQIRGFYNIDFVLDDRNQVVEMWRQLGLTCLQVAEGDF